MDLNLDSSFCRVTAEEGEAAEPGEIDQTRISIGKAGKDEPSPSPAVPAEDQGIEPARQFTASNAEVAPPDQSATRCVTSAARSSIIVSSVEDIKHHLLAHYMLTCKSQICF